MNENRQYERDGKHYAFDGKCGVRLTDCCQAFSTYCIDTGQLCCKACWEVVPVGQGDGVELDEGKLHDHAFDMAFTVISPDEFAKDVTPIMLREAVMIRLRSLSDEEITEACGLLDTMEVGE